MGSTGMSTRVSKATQRLRELLADTNKIIVAPGVHDGISARIALSMGFDALYMTGAGTSMSRLGWADIGLATQQDMTQQAEMLANIDPSVPLIADADTGYGGTVAIARTVSKYARAGVAAFHIEDQVQEKRCGHLLGKEIVPREVFYSRIQAAVNARAELGLDILIIARTDSRQSYGFEEAYERLRRAAEIGADIVFPEAMTSRQELADMIRLMGQTPCLLNMVSKGVTPDLSVDEAKEMGFRIMIFPVAGFGGAIKGIRESFMALKSTGREAEDLVGVKEAFELCGLDECIQVDQRAGGKTFAGLR
ncbi:Phosphoenolpyruvate/pyruvate domain-containing protein [Exophiala viscosa]|nr:Phosphoenolpyruvate/pyruvate domain-containing protein [Exophiala viscosa]